MAPGHITLKWCKEALETIPRLRVFLIDGLRNRVRDGSTPSGVNEVKLRRGQDRPREGLHTTLTDLRLRREPQERMCALAAGISSGQAVFVVGQDKGKLSLAACVSSCALRPLPGERGQPGHWRAGGFG